MWYVHILNMYNKLGRRKKRTRICTINKNRDLKLVYYSTKWSIFVDVSISFKSSINILKHVLPM